MNKDVLLVSAFPPPEGGIASWTVSYLDYCRKNGISVDTIDISMVGSRRINAVNTHRNYFDEIKRSKRIFKSIRQAFQSNTYSNFHINSSCSSFGIIRDYLSIRIARKNNSKVLFHCHCNLPTQINNSIARSVFKKIVKSCDLVIVLNEKSKEFAAQYDPVKTKVLPNFISFDHVDNLKVINSDIKSIQYVGHIIKAKGIDILIEVARRKPEYNFFLTGPIDEDYKYLKVPDNVHFEGRMNRNEINSRLNRADVFMFLSFSEGFSLSLLEAMACGVPVIASDVGANREMIGNEGGIIVEENNVQNVLLALEMIKDKNVRSKMSVWNINRVKNYYSEDAVLKRLIDLYEIKI